MGSAVETLRRIYKVARWGVLAGVLLALLLMLRTPAGVAPPVDAARQTQYADDFQAKVEHMMLAHRAGSAAEPATFTAAEVNAAIDESLEQDGQKALASDVGQAEIKGMQVNFVGNEVQGQFQTHAYGRDVTLTVSGRLGSRDGYVTFEPTGFKMGDLSLPVSMVNSELQKKLAAPENRAKLKLPDYVSDVRVQDGQLVVVPK